MPDADHRTCQLAIDAHRARADQQEARAAAAEEALAVFARNVEEYDQLAEQAAQGQRDSDVLKEIRRRIPPLERQAERCLRAEAKLATQGEYDTYRRALWVLVRHHHGSVFLTSAQMENVPRLASLGVGREPGGIRISASEEP